jgi:hypothetical protein
MFLFLVVICWKRPYNSPFGSIFNIFTAFLQLLGACFVAAWMFSGVPDYRKYGEDTTVVSLYLLLLKTVFDILPKVKQIGKFVISTIRGKRSKAASKKSRRNADTGLLSQQLLAAVRDEADELAGGDHADLATREMQQRGQLLTEADAELPEFDNEDNDTSAGWSDLEADEENEEDLFIEMLPEPPASRPTPLRRRTGPGLNPLEVDVEGVEMGEPRCEPQLHFASFPLSGSPPIAGDQHLTNQLTSPPPKLPGSAPILAVEIDML